MLPNCFTFIKYLNKDRIRGILEDENHVVLEPRRTNITFLVLTFVTKSCKLPL